MKARIVLFAAVVVAFAAGRAEAYPQFQLSKDQTCTGCHISPSGGGLLTENGTNVAESMSAYGTSGEFMYGKVPTPSWLMLGGDFRYQYGYLQTPQRYLLGFPMQADLYGNAKWNHFRLQVTAGYRPPEYGNENVTRIWSREHYLMWQSDADGSEGLYLRVGRFMPVFGLRFAEHPIYTRQYGGTPLYGETYAAAADYVTAKYEGHLTGFIKDPLLDSVLHFSGGAAYGEVRLSPKVMVGAEGMIAVGDHDQNYRGGLTGKLYLPKPDVLLQAEAQVNNEHIDQYGFTQLVGYVMGTWYGPRGVMVDVGAGHFDESFQLRGVKRDAVDLQIHWFTTSHIELLLTSRVEVLTTGPTGAYSFLQAHYRL